MVNEIRLSRGGGQIHVFGTDADAFQLEDGATYFLDLAVLGRGVAGYTEYPIIVWDSGPALDSGLFDTITWDLGRSDALLFDTPVVEFRPSDGGSGGMLILTNVLLAPEPASFILAAVGLLLLALCTRRRKP